MTPFAAVALLGLIGAPAQIQADNRPGEAASVCGDILAGLGRKPQHLHLVRCRGDIVHGAGALVFEYRVAGRHAAAVETQLGAIAGMPALRFICCGWDSVGTGSRDGWIRHDGSGSTVAMFSGETLHSRRSDWPQIAWFQVTVTHFLQEP